MSMSRLLGSWRQGLLLAVVAAIAVAFVAAQPRTAHASGTPKFKATEIADAVLFNDGPAAPYLANLRRGPMQWNNTTRELQARVNAAVDADPQWAGQFGSRMQSGDPQTVAVGVAQFGMLVRRVLDSWFNAQKVAQWATDLSQAWIHGQLILNVATANVNENAFDTVDDSWYDNLSEKATQLGDIQQLDAAAAAEMVSVVLLAENVAMQDPASQLLKEVVINDLAAGLKVG